MGRMIFSSSRLKGHDTSARYEILQRVGGGRTFKRKKL